MCAKLEATGCQIWVTTNANCGVYLLTRPLTPLRPPVWDYRARKEVMSVKQCEDYISDLIVDDDQRYLVASSGEGTITSFSLRSRTVHTQVRDAACARALTAIGQCAGARTSYIRQTGRAILLDIGVKSCTADVGD